MEDVRPVPMDEQASLIVFVVRVAGDMRTAIKDEDTLAMHLRKTLGDDAACEACADNNEIVTQG